MKHLGCFAVAAMLFVSACTSGGGSMDAGDGGEAGCMRSSRSRTDWLNLNCTSAAGDESAADCNQRLMNVEMGARFFIGGRDECFPDPNNCACQPLCELGQIHPDNCSFEPPASGCRYSAAEGYAVVVEANGKRWIAAVGRGGNCPSAGGSMRTWGRVNFEDLRGAAQCARMLPPGGFGPARYGSCDTPMRPCGSASAMSGDTCQSLMLQAGMMQYTANVCTHSCTSDRDCGARGVCNSGLCFDKCGGACALSCQDGFVCNVPEGATEGFCLPLPPGM